MTEAGPDPLRQASGQEGLFRSSGYLADGRLRSSAGDSWDVATLPPFLRTLLVTDGTVTKSLEAYFWEPVQVELVQQEAREEISGDAPRFIEVDLASQWLLREVALRGRSTQRRFACARSWLALSALPAELADGIRGGRIGIGELLREQGVESYREIVALDFLSSGQSDALLEGESGQWVARTYRIRVGGVPAILVTEYFPLAIYALASGQASPVLTQHEL